MAFEFNPFTGSLDSVGLSQASADARYVLKVAGSFSGLTGAGFRDTSAAFDVTLGFTSSAALTAARALTLDVVNASRSIKLAGNVDLGGNFTTTGSGTLALGGFTLTVPATGTAALLGTANVFTAAQTITQGSANAVILASTGYSLTGSNATSMIDLAGTWNTTGAPTAIKLNITRTAAAATSLLMDLQQGGVSAFNVLSNSAGNTKISFGLRGTNIDTTDDYGTRFSGYFGNIIQQNTAGVTCVGVDKFSIGGNADLLLCRKAAATLQIGQDAAGVTNQMFTAASRITSDGVGANLTIAGGNGRGGAGGDLILASYTTGASSTAGVLTTRWTLDANSGALLPGVNATYNLGASGAVLANVYSTDYYSGATKVVGAQQTGFASVTGSPTSGIDTIDLGGLGAIISNMQIAINTCRDALNAHGLTSTV